MIEEIEELKEEKDVKELMRILQEGDEKRRGDAAKALGMMKSSRDRDDVVSALVERLKKDETPTVRANAALAIGHLESKIGKKALKEAVEDDDWEVRHDAAIAMGEYEDDSFLDPLYSLLNDPENDVKRKSIEALGKVGSGAKSAEIISRLEGFLDDTELKEEAVKAVSQVHTEKALETLSQVYQNSEREIREIAVNGIGKIDGEKADNILLEALEDDSWRVREDAARFLGEKGVEEAVEPLLERLEDEKNYVVQEALRSLGLIGLKDEDGLRKIEEKIEDDDPGTRTAAVEALGKLDGEEASKILFESMDHEQNPRVLWSLSDSLSEISREYLKDLKKEVDELEGSRRPFAVVAMGKAGFSSYLEELLSMLDDDRWKVRQKAAEALRGIDPADLSKRRAEKVLRKLSKTIRDNDKWVRVESIKSLSEIIFDLKEGVETDEFKKELIKRAEVEADADVKEAIKQARNLLDI
ncbi:MAG: HEAT repeat domain-containing protein [Candidatus Thermoplasmatota archaeon]